jgi:Spy/CpxP family protein refolding chaperone
MKRVGFLNVILLVLNLSALGTIAVKTRFWEKEMSTHGTIQETLRLTPEQARAIEIRRESFAGNWEQIESELETVREELLDALRDDEPSPETVWPKVDEMARLRAQLERQAVEQLMQEKRVLTPEQQDQYFTHVERRMRQGRGYGYGRGRGARQPYSDESDLTRRGGGKGRGKGRRRQP